MWKRIEAELRANTAHYSALAALFAIGIGVRLAYLFQPAENDEIYSYSFFATKSLAYSLTHYDANNHPLNTLLVNLTTRLFGNSLGVIRLWVFLAGVAVIPLVYLMIRRLYNKESGLIAAALVVPSFMLVTFSADARGYMLQACLFLLLILVAIRIKETGKGWIWFVILTALGFYAVITFVYCFGAVVLWLLFCGWSKDVSQERKVFIRNLIIACAIAIAVTGLLFLPFVATSGLSAITSNPFVKSLAPKAFLKAAPSILKEIYRSWSFSLVFIIFPVLIAGVVLAIVFNRRISRFKVGFPLVLTGWVSLVFLAQRAAVYSRVFIPILPVFLGVSAAGLYYVGHGAFEWARSKREYTVRPLVLSLVAVAIALLMIVMVFPGRPVFGGGASSTVYSRMDNAAIARILKTRLKEGDLVYGSYFTVNPLTYYFDRYGIPLKHLYGNVRNVRSIPPKDVKRIFLVTDVNRSTMPLLLDYSNLEYNNTHSPTSYIRGDAAGVKDSPFEIQVIAVPGTT